MGEYFDIFIPKKIKKIAKQEHYEECKRYLS